MSRMTLLRRRVLLGGLIMPVLVPSARARAQASAAPPQPGRAPFGLTWGMSADSIRYLNGHDPYAENDCHGGNGNETYCQFVHLRRAPNDTERVDLSLGYRDRLFYVYAKGKTDWADQVAARYEEFSSLLSEQYGPGSETVAPRKWFGRADSDTTLRYTVFSTAEVQVELSLLSGYLSKDRDAAYWIIKYWHLAGLAEYQADDHSHKKDAL